MHMKRLLLTLFFLLTLAVTLVYADDREDYKTAIEKFKPLAKQGYAKAQYYLSGMYRSGLGVGQTIYPKKDKLNIRNHVSSWGTANNMCNLNIWMLKTV